MLSQTTVPDRRHSADVVVIGFGLVGSVLARRLTESGARVLLVDSGSAAAIPGGTHLRNQPACRSDRTYHYDLVRALLRPASVPRANGGLTGRALPPTPDGKGVNAGQRARDNLVGARVTNVLGGMGILWNCVAPRLNPAVEHWEGIDGDEWSTLYRYAEDALAVGTSVSSGRQERVLGLLADLGARPAPVAARHHGAGVRWTGPAEVLPADGSWQLIPELSVQRLTHRNGRVVSADAVALDTGERVVIEAGAFVVATGGLRAPALLWASGIHSEERSALGHYLADHPVSYGQLVLDQDLAEDDADPFVIIPIDGDRPFHSLLLCDAYDANLLEGRVDERLIVSLYWYSLSRPRHENRIRFTGQAFDATGLPQPTFEYTTTEADRAVARAALEDLRATAGRLGEFLPSSQPRVLSPGSSLHVMGTTRMGVADDGHSVADTHGRVWGFDNLYLGGTGLIPSATATNPTLAACALAVRTADRVRRG